MTAGCPVSASETMRTRACECCVATANVVGPYSERYDATADGAANGLGAVRGTELAADRCHVEFHGLIADAEADRDRFVRQAFSEELEHLDFAPGERLLVLVTAADLVDVRNTRREG